eukprot:3933312-Alexandrium_andersonii.AAC.1
MEDPGTGGASSSAPAVSPGVEAARASGQQLEDAEEAPVPVAGPAHAGVGRSDEDMSVSGERVEPEDNTDD